MRTIISYAVATAGLLLLSAPVSAQQLKIGYIDSRRVIQEAPGSQEARQLLEREMGTYQTQLRAMEDSLQTMLSDYQQRSVMLSASWVRTSAWPQARQFWWPAEAKRRRR